MQKLIRQVLTGVATPFTFDVEGIVFMVKNFSSSPIYVSIGATANTTTGIKIPAESWQTCCIIADIERSEGNRSNTVSVLGTGEVEVQVILC